MAKLGFDLSHAYVNGYQINITRFDVAEIDCSMLTTVLPGEFY